MNWWFTKNRFICKNCIWTNYSVENSIENSSRNLKHGNGWHCKTFVPKIMILLSFTGRPLQKRERLDPKMHFLHVIDWWMLLLVVKLICHPTTLQSTMWLFLLDNHGGRHYPIISHPYYHLTNLQTYQITKFLQPWMRRLCYLRIIFWHLKGNA